jgi:hypothetical protein
MRPFSLGVTTLIQGLYTLVWVAVMFDVASPTFNLSGLPSWTGIQGVFGIVLLFTGAVALGLVMHTVSRGIFRKVKERWETQVLASGTVKKRLTALDALETFPGGPRYDDVLSADDATRARQAGGFMHAIGYQIMARNPSLWNAIQVYRDQYRLARGFILPSAAFALVLPFWAPVEALDAAGYIGPFPIIRTQLFLLSILAAAVSYVAFRERSYRYSAAKLLAFTTMVGMEKENRS